MQRVAPMSAFLMCAGLLIAAGLMLPRLHQLNFLGLLSEQHETGSVPFMVHREVAPGDSVAVEPAQRTLVHCMDDDFPGAISTDVRSYGSISGIRIYEYTPDFTEKFGRWTGRHMGFGSTGTLTLTSPGRSYYIYADVSFSFACATARTPVTYYVDPVDGNDANAGTTPGNAWRTVNQVNTSMDGTSPLIRAGDTILLKNGEVFSGSIDVDVSGTPYWPLTIGAYGEGSSPQLDATGRQRGIDISNVSYVTVRDIAVLGSGIAITAAKHISINNVAASGADVGIAGWGYNDGIDITSSSTMNNASDGVQFQQTNNLHVADLITRDNGRHGLFVGATSSGIVLERILTEYNGQQGISAVINVHNLLISDSIAQWNGQDGMQFGISGSGALITDSIADNNGGDGFGISGNWKDVIFDRCVATNNGWQPGIGPGDGFSYHNSSKGIVQNSVALDNRKSGVAEVGDASVEHINNIFANTVNGLLSLAHVEGTGRHTFIHNTIYSAGGTGGGIFARYGATVTAIDNIIVNVQTAMQAVSPSVITAHHNLFFSNATNFINVTSGGGDVVADPAFIDANARDFHLQAWSPAIDAGADAGVDTDNADQARIDAPLIPNTGSGVIPYVDMGAFEWQSPTP